MMRFDAPLSRLVVCAALVSAIVGCATSRVARPGEWVVLHPELSAATGPDGGWTVGEGTPDPGVVFPLAEVAGRWLRFGGTVADVRSGLQWRINAFRGNSIATRSVPSLCDATRRCAAVAWIPADATWASGFVYSSVSAGEVRDLTVEVGRPGNENAADRVRISALLSTLEADYYRTEETDWQAVERNIATMLPPPSDVDPLPTVAQYVRDQLPGNKHMFVVPSALTRTGPTTASVPTCPDPDAPVGLAVLPGISAIEGDGPDRYAIALHDCLIASGDQRPWVVDLRGNTGGNMYPMIAGVGPLLSPGPLYAFVDGSGKPTVRIAIADSGIAANDHVVATVPSGVGQRARAPVIVLLGPRCSSACEQVANALATRPRTLFVGQDTGGYTSVNDPYPLDDDYILLLTTGYTADPCGRRIDRLHPDVVIDRIDERAVTDVLAIPAVHDWLTTTRGYASMPVAESERRSRCATADARPT